MPAEPPEAYLVLALEGGGRETFPVAAARVTLGRAPESDVVLANPRVSRNHAVIAWDGERFLVEDVGSKNGTRVNGVAIASPAPLADGDTLELGDCRLRFAVSAPTATIGPLPVETIITVDTGTHEVRRAGEVISLTPKEYQLLALLHRMAGDVVRREEIAREVWPEFEGAVADESIEQLVARLRRKIEAEPGNPKHVITVRGFGYRLEPG